MATRKKVDTTVDTQAGASVKLASVLLDRSGSMNGMWDQAIRSYNSYVDGLGNTEDLLLALTEFDTPEPAHHVHGFVAPSEAIRLNHENYVPRGGTPLWDALAQVIAWTGEGAARVQRETKAGLPPPVLVVIITDGEENSSRFWNSASINGLIKEKETQGWTFMYLGTEREAWKNEQAFVGTMAGSNVTRTSGMRGYGANVRYAASATADWAATARAGGETMSLVSDEDRKKLREASE